MFLFVVLGVLCSTFCSNCTGPLPLVHVPDSGVEIIDTDAGETIVIVTPPLIPDAGPIFVVPDAGPRDAGIPPCLPLGAIEAQSCGGSCTCTAAGWRCSGESLVDVAFVLDDWDTTTITPDQEAAIRVIQARPSPLFRWIVYNNPTCGPPNWPEPTQLTDQAGAVQWAGTQCVPSYPIDAGPFAVPWDIWDVGALEFVFVGPLDASASLSTLPVCD